MTTAASPAARSSAPSCSGSLSDIRAGKVQIIVVHKVDRLTRSLADFAKIVDVPDAHETCRMTSRSSVLSSVLRLNLPQNPTDYSRLKSARTSPVNLERMTAGSLPCVSSETQFHDACNVHAVEYHLVSHHLMGNSDTGERQSRTSSNRHS
jgi:hypothetical protein